MHFLDFFFYSINVDVYLNVYEPMMMVRHVG